MSWKLYWILLGLAFRQRVSPQQVIRRAICLMKYLHDADKAGHPVLLVDEANDSIKRLVFE
jgi:hypothetical protein